MDTATCDDLLSEISDDEDAKFDMDYDKFYARINTKNEDVLTICLKPNVIRQIDISDEKNEECKTILEK